MRSERSILIVGGGIAGLVLAIALKQRGHDPLVVEKQEAWEPEETGLILWADVFGVLRAIGLDGAIARYGCAAHEFRVPHTHDAVTSQIAALHPEYGPSPPFITISRREFQLALVDAAHAAGVRVRLGTTVRSVGDSEGAVDVLLSDGSTHRCDVVVGADGAGSSIRGFVSGDAVRSGRRLRLWRALAVGPKDLRYPALIFDGDRRMMLLPLGRSRVCALAIGDGPDFVSRRQLDGFGGAAGALLARVHPCSHPVCEEIEEVLYDGDAALGRVVLLGDASGTSVQSLGRGACRAILDAANLAESLGRAGNLTELLDAYRAKRRERDGPPVAPEVDSSSFAPFQSAVERFFVGSGLSA